MSDDRQDPGKDQSGTPPEASDLPQAAGDSSEATASGATAAEEREARERSPTPTEKSLTRKERHAVDRHGNLSALTVYSVILREGEEELHRPAASLWWSGAAAGIGISTSIVAEGIIRSSLGSDHSGLHLLESLGYSFGFVLVILCRLQLFTENTITVVLPILAEPTRARFYHAARLWGIVFAANMAGTFFVAAVGVHTDILVPAILDAILEISRHAIELSATDTLLRGIPSGFFVAALVWMLPSSKGFALLVIVMFTWLIAAAQFTHVVAGSNEIFYLVFTGEVDFLRALSHHIAPMLLGNIIGGTGLFALLAYGQVHDEM